ncbi:MAG: glutamate synthase large subunit [Candidatus Acidiferrales bacterium]
MRTARAHDDVDRDACGVGFIARIGGTPSRDVVERALGALARLSHRGGLDADGLSGDGAGLLIPIPKKFFRNEAASLGLELPESFGVGMIFIARGQEQASREQIETLCRPTGLRCLGWREVPIEPSLLGPRATATLPSIRQCFFAAQDPAQNLERALYFLRKRVEWAGSAAYFCSLSSKTIVYKGLLAPLQLRAFYGDIEHPDFQVPFAVFHQRYSTNTRPAWKLAQPFRLLGHNGEINTIGANRRWMHARESRLRRELGAGKWFRALEEGVSDSASFDNALEAFLERGYNLPAALLRMVPPAFGEDVEVAAEMRAFLESEAREQEPWDGPAALVFSDGRFVGAKLDRNGLRPMRYTLSADGLLAVGSETGLTDFGRRPIVERGRLGPGEMLLMDVETGEIYRDKEAANLASRGARGSVRTNPARLAASAAPAISAPALELRKRAALFGWTEDQFKLLFQPLGMDGKEATWSMGDDAPPAFLSSARRSLFDFCKQRFAQVTNPPIDPLRESYVMSLEVALGEICLLDSPLLDAGQLAHIEEAASSRVQRIDITFETAGGVAAALDAIARVRREAARAAGTKPEILLLTDRAVSAERVALPAMLAVASAWKALVQAEGCDLPLVVESGEVIETHHVAMLIATGAAALCPYLAMELSESLKPGGAASYRKAVENGLRKVLARMGISTVASYRNSHLFETVGLNEDLCVEFFEDATIVPGGKVLSQILEDSISRHQTAQQPAPQPLPDAGLYRYRQTGERHSNSPELVRRMHKFIQSPSDENYAAFEALSDSREPVAIRDLLEFVPDRPIALEEVEDAGGILSRFGAQAMSLGALGPEAHRTLAIAMNRLGARSNTGEGGEDPHMYRVEPEATNRVKQVASARFGVTTEYLVRADELEIKMAQGSKPGEGGQLPAAKVSPFIARLRHAVAGMTLISPPPHHDIYSIEDLAQLIYDLRAVNPRARIGVKLVSGAGVGIIAAGVAKAGADVITIAGFDGGTGASPLTSIKNTGLPWEVGLRDAHHALLRSGFRDGVRLRVDGGFKFGRDVVVAALLGADEFGFGTAALLAIGCIMARQCHLNTCPVGIATQDEKFRARYEGKPEMVMAYFRGVAEEVRRHLAFLGARSLAEISGSVERLRPRTPDAGRSIGWLLEPAPLQSSAASAMRAADRAAKKLPEPEPDTGVREKLARMAAHSGRSNAHTRRFAIANSDRSIGAHLSGEILRRTEYEGLGGDSLDCEFRGVAGQSFGAFLISGLTFRLLGEANDYVGKGLCGGTIAISAGPDASQRGDVLAGNTLLYGATGGELYVAGRVGERFAVRNSGALAVVEGVGQHGCEYMTSGIALILGGAGSNFGSGMTGGLAYALRSEIASLPYHREFLRWNDIGEDEEEWLRSALQEHLRLTGSPRARLLLRRLAPLPMVRLEPLVLPCPVAQTWAPFVARWDSRCSLVARASVANSSVGAQAAGEPLC